MWRIVQRQRHHVLNAKGMVDEFNESFLEANADRVGDGKMEVAVDLCMPIPPTGDQGPTKFYDIFTLPANEDRDALDMEGINLDYLAGLGVEEAGEEEGEAPAKVEGPKEAPERAPVAGYQQVDLPPDIMSAVSKHMSVKAPESSLAPRSEAMKDSINEKMKASTSSVIGPKKEFPSNRKSTAFMPSGLAKASKAASFNTKSSSGDDKDDVEVDV